ncbi:MAG: hypothetical protein JWR50_2524 [Mucilaginibacter sp.]|nr:hypothetical protein [Mucilaginibacter sp.]
MKISRTKFVLLFVAAAAVFMLGTTLLLKQPAESVFGTGSVLSLILSPIKMIMMGPLLPFIKWLRQDADTPPPFFLAGFVLYWTVLGYLIYALLCRLKIFLKKDLQ